MYVCTSYAYLMSAEVRRQLWLPWNWSYKFVPLNHVSSPQCTVLKISYYNCLSGLYKEL